MKAISIISQDLFDKVRSRFSNLEMGDETGAVTIDPLEARFFDFDFVHESQNLGRVSISLNDLGSLKVYYSQGITENQDDPVKHEWFRFLKEMRFFAMRRLLRFDTRDIAKTNLDKKDFQHLATTQGPKEEPEMNTMNESRWNEKSSKKTSRAIQGKTEVIVRHARPVDEEYAGSRSQRKNIKAIFIQNADGERFKYPFVHPAGAFAMAQHVDHGGIPHDPAGKAIIRMSEEIAKLQEFQRKINKATLHDDATGITERAIGRLQELKATVDSLGKRHHYENWMAGFQEDPMMDDGLEMDEVTMEEYKQKFTQTSFQEELSAYFPLLHRIMGEANKIDLESYVEENVSEVFDIGMGKASHGRTGPENEFEDWANATEQNKLTDDQVAELKSALGDYATGNADLQLGPDGQTAAEFFSHFGLDDNDLKDKLASAADLDPESDPIEALKSWAKESYPELLVALGLSDTNAPAEPAPEQPVAESVEDRTSYQVAKILADKGIEYDPESEGELVKAIGMVLVKELNMSPAQARSIINSEDFLSDTMGELRYMGQQGMEENEEAGGMPNTTMPTREAVVKEVAKLVKSRFNGDNPEVGPFNGVPNIALDVKKKCAEMFGEEVGDQAEGLALQFMEKLSQKWEAEHGQIGDDGLARLKELLGNVKSKVEGIGDVTQNGHAPGNNIMSSEETAFESLMRMINFKK
jgi:hypothetical protein